MKFLAAAQALKEKGFDIAVNGVNKNGADPSISEVFSDSRKVMAGSIFCCIQGEKKDGHQYISAAENSGAAALICERAVNSSLPMILVSRIASKREVLP